MYGVICFLEGKKDSIVIKTSQPMLLLGAVALCVNPSHKIYKKYIGKCALMPRNNNAVPVYGDESLDLNATRLIVPTHCQEDYEFACLHQLSIDQYIYDIHGRTSDRANEFAHKHINDSELNILQFLQDIGNIKNQTTQEREHIYDTQGELLRPLLASHIHMVIGDRSLLDGTLAHQVH